MQFMIIFRVIFWIGIAILLSSLFIPIELFLPVLGLGVLCITYGIYEQYLSKKTSTPLALHPSLSPMEIPPAELPRQAASSPIAKSRRLPKTSSPSQKNSFFSRFFRSLTFHRHEKKPHIAFQQRPPSAQPNSPPFIYHTPQFEHAKKLFQTSLSPPSSQQLPTRKESSFLFDWENEDHYIPTGAEHLSPETSLFEQRLSLPSSDEPQLPPHISLAQTVPLEQPSPKNIPLPLSLPAAARTETLPPQTDEQHLATLRAYVTTMIKQQYPLSLIRDEVLKAGWPEPLVQRVVASFHPRHEKKKQIIILGILLALLVVGFIFLSRQDLLLFGQIVELFSYASPEFYIGASIIALLIFAFIVFKTRKLIRVKKIRYQQVQSKHVQEIKEELQQHQKGFETDFDRLYQLLQEKKKLLVSEVAAGFGITKAKAEEWGKILKEQGIIDLHYPPVGEAELQWKK